MNDDDDLNGVSIGLGLLISVALILMIYTLVFLAFL